MTASTLFVIYRCLSLDGNGMSVLWGKTDVFFSFDVTCRSSALWVAKYSDYQKFLHQTISSLRKDGLNFQQIADWLNENGYSTVRGKRFRNTHVHSIIKKKSIRDDRVGKNYPSLFSNCRLELVDKSLVGEV